MKVLVSWIRDFVDVPGTPDEIGARMSLRGLVLDGIEHRGDDAVLDFDVTANRPDCLSILGIAREMATVYGLPLRESGRAEGHPSAGAAPGTPPGHASAGAAPGTPPAGPIHLPVTIEDPELCRRYVAAVADVTIGPSPTWMQARLNACGVRPISNVVDITNYVLLELGHPMHAFDLARLAGPAIAVRRARPGETLTTLDGKRRTMNPDILVIADAERASAIGGVMGGAESEVSKDTRQIVFESAWFKPQSVRATAKRLGLRTEASYRFERGADLIAAGRAMARAVALLESTGAGWARGPVIDCYPAPYKERHLVVDRWSIERLLGMHVPDVETERILTSLGFGVRTLGSRQAAAPEAAAPMGQPGHSWQLQVPSWRVDVGRGVDVIEEVGKHYGFEHLPATFPAIEQPPPLSDSRLARDARVRGGLVAMGFSEVVTLGFIETAAAAPYVGDNVPLVLANPLSEKFSTLRPSLVPGLVDAVSHNRRHGRRDVRLFEIGTRFSPQGETRAGAAAWTGTATPDDWSGGRRDVDFFDIKGVAEQVCGLMGLVPQFSAVSTPFLVEGRAAELRVDDQRIGVIGELDPAVGESRDLPTGDPVYVLELNLDLMSERAPRGTRFARPLPRHPSVVRDVSLLVDDSLSADTVRGTIRVASAARMPAAPLVDMREFDRYQGKGIPDGKVSLSLRLTFQAPDRTLTDGEVQRAMDVIVAALVKELGAVQR